MIKNREYINILANALDCATSEQQLDSMTLRVLQTDRLDAGDRTFALEMIGETKMEMRQSQVIRK